MYLEKIVSEGIAHNSYFVEDDGDAFVIDPRRDVDIYVELAKRTCSRISHVFETHRNEDYISGSLDLQKLTGCNIIHGKNLDFGYGIGASEGETFEFGNLWLDIIETPGHSPESLSYVLYMKGIPWGVFTGDAVFYGSTGRVDLFGQEEIKDFAFLLYHSVYDKIMTLGEDVLLFPAHGAGTACGGAEIADIPLSTIGYELSTNPTILNLSMDKFIKIKYEEKIPLPPYFENMANKNLIGTTYVKKRICELDVNDFLEEISSGVCGEGGGDNCTILDTRQPLSYAGGHIPGSYNIWMDGLPKYAGWIFDYEKNILIVPERKNDIDIIQTYLMRIGFDNIKGYLCGGIESWQNMGFPLEQSGIETVEGLESKLKEGKDFFLLDVRGKEEFESGHIPGAVNIHIGELESRLNELGSDKPIISICGAGNRGSLGVSILRRHGYKDVFNLIGGMAAWNKKGYKTSQ